MKEGLFKGLHKEFNQRTVTQVFEKQFINCVPQVKGWLDELLVSFDYSKVQEDISIIYHAFIFKNLAKQIYNKEAEFVKKNKSLLEEEREEFPFEDDFYPKLITELFSRINQIDPNKKWTKRQKHVLYMYVLLNTEFKFDDLIFLGLTKPNLFFSQTVKLVSEIQRNLNPLALDSIFTKFKNRVLKQVKFDKDGITVQKAALISFDDINQIILENPDLPLSKFKSQSKVTNSLNCLAKSLMLSSRSLSFKLPLHLLFSDNLSNLKTKEAKLADYFIDEVNFSILRLPAVDLQARALFCYLYIFNLFWKNKDFRLSFNLANVLSGYKIERLHAHSLLSDELKKQYEFVQHISIPTKKFENFNQAVSKIKGKVIPSVAPCLNIITYANENTLLNAILTKAKFAFEILLNLDIQCLDRLITPLPQFSNIFDNTLNLNVEMKQSDNLDHNLTKLPGPSEKNFLVKTLTYLNYLINFEVDLKLKPSISGKCYVDNNLACKALLVNVLEYSKNRFKKNKIKFQKKQTTKNRDEIENLFNDSLKCLQIIKRFCPSLDIFYNNINKWLLSVLGQIDDIPNLSIRKSLHSIICDKLSKTELIKKGKPWGLSPFYSALKSFELNPFESILDYAKSLSKKSIKKDKKILCANVLKALKVELNIFSNRLRAESKKKNTRSNLKDLFKALMVLYTLGDIELFERYYESFCMEVNQYIKKVIRHHDSQALKYQTFIEIVDLTLFIRDKLPAKYVSPTLFNSTDTLFFQLFYCSISLENLKPNARIKKEHSLSSLLKVYFSKHLSLDRLFKAISAQFENYLTSNQHIIRYYLLKSVVNAVLESILGQDSGLKDALSKTFSEVPKWVSQSFQNEFLEFPQSALKLMVDKTKRSLPSFLFSRYFKLLHLSFLIFEEPQNILNHNITHSTHVVDAMIKEFCGKIQKRVIENKSMYFEEELKDFKSALSEVMPLIDNNSTLKKEFHGFFNAFINEKNKPKTKRKLPTKKNMSIEDPQLSGLSQKMQTLALNKHPNVKKIPKGKDPRKLKRSTDLRTSRTQSFYNSQSFDSLAQFNRKKSPEQKKKRHSDVVRKSTYGPGVKVSFNPLFIINQNT